MEARQTLRSAFALGSFENLSIQRVKFLSFCVYFQLVPLPATTLVLVWYAQYLSKKFKVHGSIIQYLSGVKTLHTLLDYSMAGFGGILLKLTLRGLRCNNQHIVRRARPMTPALLKAIHTELNLQNPLRVVFWGVSVLAFLLLFRKSNLVPTLTHGFNGKKQLRHADCYIDYKLRRVIVGIRWAKNHQYGQQLLTFPLPELPNSVLCPLKAVESICNMMPWTVEQHLFQLPGGGSLTYRKFQEMLSTFLKQLNVQNYRSFSSHSYRRGGMMFVFLCDVPLPLLKILGNWRSEVYLTYIKFPLETRSAACYMVKKRLMIMEQQTQ